MFAALIYIRVCIELQGIVHMYQRNNNNYKPWAISVCEGNFSKTLYTL